MDKCRDDDDNNEDNDDDVDQESRVDCKNEWMAEQMVQPSMG